ncbi:MAG: hypothetical protein IKV35_01970, partial [Clostridia bacterium]|nr:hypothetical protein [Clostridia bacterium]
MQKAKVWTRVIGVFAACVLLMSLLLSIGPVKFESASAVDVTTEAALLSAISSNQNIVLKSDIDLTTDSAQWVSNNYSGEFDGAGHVISGLDKPLFASVDGGIRNLGVIGDVSGNAMLARTIYGTIENCFAYGSITHSGGTAAVGGLVGVLSGTVTNSFTCVNITVNGATMDTYVCGFAGIVEGSADVSACYSTGTLEATDGYIAGFGNYVAGTVSDTYTTCQLKNATPFSKASGVDGLYDNQLGLARESTANVGKTTRELMGASELSSNFAVTSTAYPALHVFYGAKWSKIVQEIVKVSITAAAFSDVTAANRKEPSDLIARADYLTRDVYIDRTNMSGIKWSVDSTSCKVYDTVPSNNVGETMQDHTTGAGEDLLRARFEFSANVTDAVMTATSTNGFEKKWYISAYNANPYFAGGDGNTASTSFKVSNYDQFDTVRYYVMMTANGFYKMTANVTHAAQTYYPIANFRGTFDGGYFSLINFRPSSLKATSLGVFANSLDSSVIKNLFLENPNIGDENNTLTTGALIGEASKTTVSSVGVKGNTTKIYSAGKVGGLIGYASSSTISKILVSVDISGVEYVGAIVGDMNGG